MNFKADISGDPDARMSGFNSSKAITISEFRAHKKYAQLPKDARPGDQLLQTILPIAHKEFDRGARYTRNFPTDQAEPNPFAYQSPYFIWKTLVGYINYFCRHLAWSPEEVRIK
jgi:hypothetical protein